MAQHPTNPFIAAAPSQTITVAATTAAVALNGVNACVRPVVELQNAGSAVVFVDFGTSGVTTAVATGYPVLPGQSKLVTITSSATHIATISGTAGQTLYVTVGMGI